MILEQIFLKIERNSDHVNFLTLNFEKGSLIHQKTNYILNLDIFLSNKGTLKVIDSCVVLTNFSWTIF